jgi:hypothetical protein
MPLSSPERHTSSVQDLSLLTTSFTLQNTLPNTMPAIIISPYEQELDLSNKNGAKLYEKGAKKLPYKFTGEVKDLHLFINYVVSRATECCWDISILNFVVDGETLNLHTDYGKIPMQTIVDAHKLHNAVTPVTNKDARAHIDSIMMYKCHGRFDSNSLAIQSRVAVFNVTILLSNC